MKIEYPYLPPGRKILYVSKNNRFMRAAEKISKKTGCIKQPTGAVIVKDGKIIGRGTNAGSKQKECPRWGSPTGANYEPCKNICEQEGHSEITSIRNAQVAGHDTRGADLYLYGHWWCCKPCWDAMIKAGIKNVYLLKNSQDLFNPEINTAMKNWGKPKKT